MKVLVTGGAGFLGSHLVERLLTLGHDVAIIDVLPPGSEWKIEHLRHDPRLEIHRGSVVDVGLVEKLVERADVIYHLAAIVGVEHYVERPYDVIDVNVNGTKILLDLAFQFEKKILFTSTSEVYGKSAKVPFLESDDRVLGPTTIHRWSYSSAKAIGEHLCFAYASRGLRVVVVRLFNAYGPRLDSPESGRVMSIFMGQLLRGQPLAVIGDGSQTRCFTYVTDMVEGLILAAVTPDAEGQVFNLGTDVETSVVDLARGLIQVAGGKGEIRFVASEGVYGLSYEDIPRRVPDITKARRVLGFAPTVPLNVGLATTFDWFQQNWAYIEEQHAAKLGLRSGWNRRPAGGDSDHHLH